MSIRVISAAVLWLVAGSVLAEPPASPAPSAQDGASRIDRLGILLDLDEGQKVAVKKVFDEQFASRQALRKEAKESGTRPSREEMHAKHEQMRQEMVEKLRPILSDQQMTKFEALAEHPPGPRPGRHRDHQQ